MLQLIQLRCFVTVAADLHFGRAAARLNMTQPPLTRHIQQLEHALGVRLFDRDRRSVQLTAGGKAFLPEAEDILRRVRSAEMTARQADGQATGRVTLGFIPVASYSLLPQIVEIARRELPGIALDLKELGTAEQLEALALGRIDMALVRPMGIGRSGAASAAGAAAGSAAGAAAGMASGAQPGTTGASTGKGTGKARSKSAAQSSGSTASTALLREPFVLALPSGHRLARRRKVGVSELDGEDCVMYSPVEGRYCYEMLAGVLRAANVTPRYVQHVTHTHSILSLVNAGVGLALVPASARCLPFANVVFKPLDLGTPVQVELHLAMRADPPNAAARQLHKKLLAALGA